MLSHLLGSLLKGLFFAIISGVQSGIDAVIHHKGPKRVRRQRSKKVAYRR